MSDSTSSIALYRERGITDVLNVTFRFLRDRFGPLCKGLLLLAGPFLVAANVLATFTTRPGAVATGAGQPMLLLFQFSLATIGGVVAAAVVIGAIQVDHDEGGSALTTRRLWGMTRTHGLALFGRQIQAGVVLGLVGILIGAVFAGVAAVAGAFQDGTPVTAIILGGVGFISLLAWLLYAAPTFTLLLPGQVDPDRSISLRRCVRLVAGRWGQTLGVWLLASLIVAIIFSVGWISQFILGALQTLVGAGSIAVVVVGIISGVANTLAPAVGYTAITIQYYNLIEQKEQVSLEEEIRQMEEGTSPGDMSSEDEKDQNRRGTATSEAERDDSEGAPTGSDAADAEPDDDTRWQDHPPGASDRSGA